MDLILLGTIIVLYLLSAGLLKVCDNLNKHESEKQP
jgi:hypothetical protein